MRGTLPTWLEPLLGLDAAESGEGTIWKLSYHWPWPAWLTLLAALAACSFIATMYFREAVQLAVGCGFYSSPCGCALSGCWRS